MLRRQELRWFGIALIADDPRVRRELDAMYMWWAIERAGALSGPILPLLAPMIAIAFRNLRSTSARMISGFCCSRASP